MLARIKIRVVKRDKDLDILNGRIVLWVDFKTSGLAFFLNLNSHFYLSLDLIIGADKGPKF